VDGLPPGDAQARFLPAIRPHCPPPLVILFVDHEPGFADCGDILCREFDVVCLALAWSGS